MSRAQLLAQGRQSVQIDIFWLFWTVVAFLIFAWLPVYTDSDPALAFKSMIGFSLLLGGTAMAFILCGFKSDRFFSLEDFAGSLGFIIVGMVAIFMVNKYAPVALSLSSVPISGTLFMMLMGISEEALFRGFLTTMFAKMTGSSLIAVGLSSIIGVAYHGAVYGASDMNLVIVFGSFAVLGFTYVLSGYRLSVPMTAHVIVNYLASVAG